MFRLKENTHVKASLDRCFLLSTSIALVEQTIGLKPVKGKTTGLIVGGDQLVWRGWKFGVPAMHETLITAYDRPRFFQDTMGRGRFRFFQHDHHFEEFDGQTMMSDVVKFSMPFGPLGRLVGKWIVMPHILRLMRRRFTLLKRLAESPEGDRYLQASVDFQASSGQDDAVRA